MTSDVLLPTLETPGRVAGIHPTLHSYDKDLLQELAEQIALELRTRYVCISLVSDRNRQRLRTLAFWRGARLSENIEYSIQGTPCQVVLDAGFLIIPSRVTDLFPADHLLKEIDAESYLGVPLSDERGTRVGKLTIIDTEPFHGDVASYAAKLGHSAHRVMRALGRGCGQDVDRHTDVGQSSQRRLFPELVGRSRSFNSMLSKVAQVADSELPILITGETGTGKELVAEAIHRSSRRSHRPMVKVNCAALSPTLIESELFGHERGAFTDAHSSRAGFFQAADRGTLLLDEIGELSLEAQAKILRVLEYGEVTAVGSTATKKVDVRVVAATHRNLAADVESSRFRRDLFFRLNVVPIEIPPLRQRRSDILELARFFARRYATRIGKHFEDISPQLADRLLAHDWPGNVRELKNVIERTAALGRSPLLLPVDDVVPTDSRQLGSRQDRRLPQGFPSLESIVKGIGRETDRHIISLRALEKRYIQYVLGLCLGRVEGPQGAARLLEMNPSTLRSRIRKLGIRKPERWPARVSKD